MTVYFARTNDTTLIKIGVVADDGFGQRRYGRGTYERPLTSARLESRMYALGKQLKRNVELVAVTDGYLLVERWFHRRHECSSVGREWFKPCPKLLGDIVAIASFGKVPSQPEEPRSADQLSGALLAYCRQRLSVSARQMASIVRVSSDTYYRQREKSSGPIVWAVDIASAAVTLACDLDLTDIVTAADAECHRLRYRCHAVRDCVRLAT